MHELMAELWSLRSVGSCLSLHLRIQDKGPRTSLDLLQAHCYPRSLSHQHNVRLSAMAAGQFSLHR